MTQGRETQKRLILTSGLPRSGKSTWAREQGLPVVNPDSIRLALHGQAYVPAAEPMVWAIARYMVHALFIAGHDTVILDATNTTQRRVREWASKDWTLTVQYFTTSSGECVRRALRDDGQSPLLPVIERMARQWDHTIPLDPDP